MTYLARKAGFETLLLDRRGDAPATGTCHRFVAVDLTDHEALTRALRSVDLLLPATENAEALQSLVEWCAENRMPLAFDPAAYAISSSKSASDALFRRLGVPAPAPWPDCTFPVVAKPDGESGGREVEVFPDLQALERRFGLIPPSGRVLQAYVAGPSYSIEVMGRPGGYTPLQTTALEMDRDFGCKRVVAPSPLPSDLTESFERTAVALAEAVGLEGIMDVEAILHEGQLKVLEIDARFPSQTPIAVYHSTGINMVERLANVFLAPDRAEPVSFEPVSSPPPPPVTSVLEPVTSVLEHIRVREGHLSVRGEQIMAENGPLHLEADFFGADEALTSHTPGKAEWVATLMVKGSDLHEAWERRDRTIHEIRSRFGLTGYSDESPEERKGRVR